MPDAIWYYADGDEERGPVTETQIRTLIKSNAIKRDDLVWKEGMDDWAPAGEVPGLYEQKPPAPPVEPVAGRTKKAGSSPEVALASPPAESRSKSSPPARSSIDVSGLFEGLKSIPALGRGVLMFGFLIILLTRGCDSMSVKYAERIKAKSQVAELQFQDDWNRVRSVIESRQQALREKAISTAEDRTKLTELSEQLLELNGAKQKELDDLRRGEWRELATAARDATANRAMASYWREAMFWLGALAFSVGLWIVGLTGRSAERWLCLVMLAIIVYSLFVPAGGAG